MHGLQTRWWTVALGIGLAGCALNGVGGTDALTATEVDCAMVQPDLEIDIVDNAYEPADAMLPDGGVVRWTHRGQLPHTVTSGDPGADDAGAMFASPDLAAGDTYCLQFEGRGTAAYYCEYHPDTMRDARIRVDEGGMGDLGDMGGAGGMGGMGGTN